MSRSRLRHPVVVLLVTLAALAAAGRASAATRVSQLLAQYQPVTVFDRAELFRPVGVRPFVTGADLEQLQGSSWVLVDSTPRPDELPTGPGFRLNEDGCSPAGPIGGLACFSALSASRREDGSLVYGRAVRLDDAIVLQYWFFYDDDVYSYVYAPTDQLWQSHEGDWEMVQVVLTADKVPVEVGYSQHCLGQRRGWDTTPRVGGTHPVVYVAVGSHANYFTPGTHQLDTRCIPPEVLALLRQIGLPLPVDYAVPGTTSGPAGLATETTRVKLINDDTEGWLAFPGTWGEAQYFHSPLTGTLPLGTSPVGPAFHAIWADPLGTQARWSAG